MSCPDSVHFGQVHIQCPVHVAIARNRSRPESLVAESTIEGMGDRMEVPGEKSWETSVRLCDGTWPLADM